LNRPEIEWSTEVKSQQSILLELDPAVLLTFFSDHVGVPDRPHTF
jgi:hypothetical protein